MLLCACIGLTAQAQQLPNGNFDGDWEANHPYIGSSNNRTKGDQPVGWCVANVDGMKGTMATAVAAKIDGTTGNAVKLTNSKITGSQSAPGYMCLGTTWNTSTGLFSITNKDGGSFGGYAFQGYKPDAIEFMYQCAGGTGTVVAYLWKGTWTQTSVPVTTASGASSLTKVDMVDRDRNILGIAHSQGGEVTKSAEAELIASLQESITDAPTSWTKRTIEFDYKNANAAPEKINVIFAANDYFDSDNITVNNSLMVDDVKLVYYSQLKSVSVNGTAINGFAEDKYEYTVNEEYAEGCLTTEVKGVAATQTVAYNEETGVATITVKGQDWTESNRNEHVYTVQFALPAAPALASLKISGEDFALAEDVVEYELPYVYNKGIVFEPVADEASTLGETTYNDEEKTVSISVTNEKGKETVYVFRFGTLDETAAESGDYKGALSVVLQTTDATSNGLLNNAAIVLTKNASGTYNLTLNDFSFIGMLIGDIFVPNITLTDGKLEATRTIMITSATEGAMGPMLGALPVKVSASLIDTDLKAAAASIDILTSESPLLGSMFQGIHVDFVPYEVEAVAADGAEWSGPQHYENVKVSGRVTKETAKFLHINNKYTNSMDETEEYPMTYIDLTKAIVDEDVTYADIMTGAPEKNNTLVYLPENSKLTDANTVVGGKAANLALTENAPFYAPTAFDAENVTFDRTFSTGKGDISSFVMPFEMNVTDIKGILYVFQGVNSDNEALFQKVIEGVAAANKPYLLEATDANPFNAVKNVKVTATADTAPADTIDSAIHFGTYATQEVTSDEESSYYSYVDGVFAKTATAALNPFNTMIEVAGANVPETLTLILLPPTGISEAASATGNADVYTIDGKLVRHGVETTRALDGLAKGVYVVNGKKVVK